MAIMVTSIGITSKSKSFVILYKLYVSEADLEAESIPRDAHVGLHHPQGKRGEEEKMLRHQRSRANGAFEPDHETDPDVRRNHPLVRWRESFRQQHARCESSFLPIHAGPSFSGK